MKKRPLHFLSVQNKGLSTFMEQGFFWEAGSGSFSRKLPTFVVLKCLFRRFISSHRSSAHPRSVNLKSRLFNITLPVEIKCQLDATDVFIADLIACSTCFGHHYAHHQELKSIIQWLLRVVFCAVFFFQVAGLVWS